MSIMDRIAARFFAAEVRRRVRAALSAESDQSFPLGAHALAPAQGARDRYEYDRGEALQQALEAWRINPLARRIVGLTTQYVVGSGITIACKHPATNHLLKAFWRHRLNRMPVRVAEMCDELTRSGNLFVLLSTDPSGMSYVRTIPAQDIERIQSRENDVEQALSFYPKGSLENPQPPPWRAYDEGYDAPGPDGCFQPVMLHYAINRPVGAQWGESDLSPVLRWLSRYAGWLEDRARLNRFRNAFLFVVKGRFSSEVERIARQRALNANPPGPGSILVSDESETWEIISPRLESSDANTDGLALKKMIAAGAGVPLHFLAEPESSTRTTAEAAGGPTYRHYEQRQRFFLWVIEDLLRVALNRRALVDPHVKRKADILVQGCDISARDNVALSMATAQITQVLTTLRDRALIDDSELLRMAYRFAGEPAEVEELLARGAAAPPPKTTEASRPATCPGLPKPSLDPQTGEPRKDQQV